MTTSRSRAEAGGEHSEEALDGLGSLARKMFSHGAAPEERLAELIERHRRALDEQARRFEETLTDLERREQLLSDSRSSIERLLRLGTTDLDLRETELAELVRELTERELRVREQEADLARRRSELGAVELKRLALEQREQSLERREARIRSLESARDEQAGTTPAEEADPSSAAALALVPGARYRLVELETSARACERLVVDGDEYVVLRLGPSPLPGDRRRCAYLERAPRSPAAPEPSPDA